MRIAFISTYPPIECGLATYTKYLTDAMKKFKKEIFIVSQIGAKGENTFPVYAPQHTDIAYRLFHIVEKTAPDIIHIEHEFGLFGSRRGFQIVDFLLRCKLTETPVVTTLHTVYTDLSYTEKIIIQHIIDNSSAIIVHETYQKKILEKNYNHQNKIAVIPHGIRLCKKTVEAKKILGLENKKVILLSGYLRSTKCFEKIIKLFPKIVDQLKNATLLLAIRTRILEHSEYKNYLYELVEKSPVKNNIKVLTGQFPQYTFDTILSAADLMALPYTKGGQSGILSQSSAFELPAVTSNIDSFSHWCKTVNGGLCCKTDDDYVKNIIKILTDDDYSKQLQQNIRKHNKLICWDKIADIHMDIYKKIINGLFSNAEFFYVPKE
ncbi:MAG: glycosyltransferase [Bacteroidetes bacterium]|nr:glycosyltransferase [Bacteroidota bacterium]